MNEAQELIAKQFYTYLHCKPNGDPFYVGKGSGGRSRSFSHGRSQYHKNIVAKYGRENILVYVFECASESEAMSDEVQHIAQLRREGFTLVNLTDGGDGTSGWRHTPESLARLSAAGKGKKKPPLSIEAKRKMSLARMGNKNRLGHKHSEATLAKMSASRFGKTHTEESKKRMTVAQTGNQHWLGKKHSEETKIRMSMAGKGASRTDECKAKMSVIAKQRYASMEIGENGRFKAK